MLILNQHRKSSESLYSQKFAKCTITIKGTDSIFACRMHLCGTMIVFICYKKSTICAKLFTKRKNGRKTHFFLRIYVFDGIIHFSTLSGGLIGYIFYVKVALK